MRDAWQDFLRRLGGSRVAFNSNDVDNWKPADFKELCDLGLLQEAEPATHIICTECFGHGAEVNWTEDGKQAFVFLQ